MTIEVTAEGDQRFREIYTIGRDPGQGQVQLPGTIAVSRSDETPAGTRFSVTVKASLKGGGDRLVRKASMVFVEEKQKLLRMPLRFACLDFPTVCKDNQTCRAGECVDDSVDLEKAPDLDADQAVQSEGACFDRAACVPKDKTVDITAAFAASADDERCTVSLADLAAVAPAGVAEDIRKGEKLNFGFVWTANTSGKWTAVDHDEEEGWTFTDATRTAVKLAPGLCKVAKNKVLMPDGRSRIVKAITNPACPPKPASMPECPVKP